MNTSSDDDAPLVVYGPTVTLAGNDNPAPDEEESAKPLLPPRMPSPAAAFVERQTLKFFFLLSFSISGGPVYVSWNLYEKLRANFRVDNNFATFCLSAATSILILGHFVLIHKGFTILAISGENLYWPRWRKVVWIGAAGAVIAALESAYFLVRIGQNGFFVDYWDDNSEWSHNSSLSPFASVLSFAVAGWYGLLLRRSWPADTCSAPRST